MQPLTVRIVMERLKKLKKLASKRNGVRMWKNLPNVAPNSNHWIVIKQLDILKPSEKWEGCWTWKNDSGDVDVKMAQNYLDRYHNLSGKEVQNQSKEVVVSNPTIEINNKSNDVLGRTIEQIHKLVKMVGWAYIASTMEPQL